MVNLVDGTQRVPGRSFSYDLRRALGNPLRAWKGVRHWALLARYGELPYAELVRYRRELFDHSEFQGHLARCLREVHYSFAGLAELYAVVRAFRPDVVIETGVSSGMSSAHILLALAANGTGKLHSIDLPNVQQGSILPDGRATGWIVPDSLRGRWELQIGDSRQLLPDLLRRLDRVDLFLHDSDHSYENMSFEFEQVWPWIERGGLLLSDDAHLHSAWDDFCARHDLRPARVARLGITRKPGNSRTSPSGGSPSRMPGLQG
jgi:predicted O-methyltransferase YrrM